VEGDLEDAALDIFDYGFGRACQITQQVATFGDNRLAGDQWPLQYLDRCGAAGMEALAAIEQRHNNPGVQQDRRH
jgi:hypothetical protein